MDSFLQDKPINVSTGMSVFDMDMNDEVCGFNIMEGQYYSNFKLIWTSSPLDNLTFYDL